MKSGELEAQVKELTATIAKLEARVTLAEDIEAIKKFYKGLTAITLNTGRRRANRNYFPHSPDVTSRLMTAANTRDGKES